MRKLLAVAYEIMTEILSELEISANLANESNYKNLENDSW